MVVERFRSAVESHDASAFEELLAEDVVFSSPAVFKPYVGREATLFVLRAVVTVFEDFRYTADLPGDEWHGLVFEARVGDRAVQGIDLIRTNDDDSLITDLTVMVRPLSGLQALVEAMGRALQEATAG